MRQNLLSSINDHVGISTLTHLDLYDNQIEVLEFPCATFYFNGNFIDYLFPRVGIDIEESVAWIQITKLKGLKKI